MYMLEQFPLLTSNDIAGKKQLYNALNLECDFRYLFKLLDLT
jgi:hypothetical protein